MSAQVAVIMGSKSDLPRIQGTLDTLRDFGVDFDVRVMSAHRTPIAVAEFAETAEDVGLKVIIAAAGGAAHLAGTVAAHTLLPVIGLPVKGGALDGLDALLSTVQMPGGVPVATTGLGSGGAKNAALLAIQILALSQPALRDKLQSYREEQAAAVESADSEVQSCSNDSEA